MAETLKVSFQLKSYWQKSDCINRNANYQCPNPSTLEAVCGIRAVARVRCCEDKKCKERVAELARIAAR